MKQPVAVFWSIFIEYPLDGDGDSFVVSNYIEIT